MMPLRSKLLITLTLLIAVASLTPALSWAIDLQPGEIKAPVPDMQYVQTTYQFSEKGAKYAHGQKLPSDTKIDTSQIILRYAKSYEVADRTGIFYIQTPVGYTHPGGSLSSLQGDSGVGDTTLVLGFWPYANKETATYFGVGGYLFIPTGSYSNQRSLNVGDNRYKFALQTGMQTAVVDNLQWLIAVDSLWYGDNDEYGVSNARLTQKTLYSAQTGLIYDLNKTFSVAGSYFYTQGGETSVNGISKNDTTQSQRFQISGIARTPIGRITLQYGHDLETKNGYIENNRFIVRYTKPF